MTRRSVLTICAALPFAKTTLGKQETRKRLSPHETATIDLGGKKVSIVYGRPYLKGREVGKEVAPFGKVWRLGADEATKITVTANTVIGDGVDLQPGSYSLFAVTGADKWTMVVNTVADQWGAFKYDQAKDLKRFDLPVQKPAAPVEEFTISLDKQGTDTAKLTLAWGNESVSTTLRVS